MQLMLMILGSQRMLMMHNFCCRMVLTIVRVYCSKRFGSRAWAWV